MKLKTFEIRTFGIIGIFTILVFGYGFGQAEAISIEQPIEKYEIGQNYLHGGETSQIRFVHLSADAPAVDVIANKSIVLVKELVFTEATKYLTVPAGNYTIDVVPTGSNIGESVLTINGVEANGFERYTAVVHGSLGDLRAMIAIEDQYPVKPNHARVTAAHAAAGVGEVHVGVLVKDNIPLPLWNSLAYGEVAEGYDLVATGYRVGFDVTGNGIPDVSFQLPDLTINENALVVAGADIEGGAFLLVLTRDGGSILVEPEEYARVRALHLSPDAPAVDLWFDRAEAYAGDVGYGEGTGFLSLVGKPYDVDITPTEKNVDSSVLSIDNLPVDIGIQKTLVVYNDLEHLRVVGLEEDFSDPGTNMFRWRIMNTAKNIGEMNIWMWTDDDGRALVLPDFEYGATSKLIDMPVKKFELELDYNGDTFAEQVISFPKLAEGTSVNIFLTNTPAGELVAKVQSQTGEITTYKAFDAAPRLDVELDMPATHFSPGDMFYMNAHIKTLDDTLPEVPFFAILYLAGNFYLYPEWDIVTGVEATFIPLDGRYETVVPVFPTSVWPETGDFSFDGITVFAGLLDQTQSYHVAIDSIQFGFGPR